MAKKLKPLWVFDCETDPFFPGRIPRPFLWCAISENGERVIYWGDDATEKFIDFLKSQPDCLMLAHHGGKFDSMFLLHEIFGNALIVDGRIIKFTIGRCEIRDSFSILPVALNKIGHKIKIDYEKLERKNRQKFRREITEYCLQDCVALLSAVENFYARAGRRRLTIASQASHELRTIYPDLPKLGANHYEEFKKFFYGGRVQSFEKGIFKGDFTLYDVNSMYPDRMANCNHPFGASYNIYPYHKKHLPEDGCGFFIGVCDSNGAFPVRHKIKKTTPYEIGRVEIAVTLHEINAALECGLVKNLSGHILLPHYKTDFSKFILPHYASRLRAKECGDHGGDIYHKLIPNSSYGRFAMSPDGRDEIYFCEQGENIIEKQKKEKWVIKSVDMDNERYILSRPTPRPWTFYEDVATGASIAGASRAKLMLAIHRSKRPMMCDTDSLLCAEFNELSDSKILGAWKIEATCDEVAIAGKKMYALYKNGECIKQASKGVNATPAQIYSAANGDIVSVVNSAPSFSAINPTKFITRNIRIT